MSIFLRQIRSPFIYLLLGASFLAIALGEYVEGGMILFFVLVNTMLGFYQEYKAEQTILLLKKYILSMVNVRRNGKDVVVPSTCISSW